MLEGGLLLVPLAEWAGLFMMIVARLSPVVFMMPGIGEQAIPVRVRLAVLLGFSIALLASGFVSAPSLSPFSNYLIVLLGELVIGFVVGVSLRAMLWVLSIAGSIIAQSIGLAQFLGVALQTEAQTITSNLLTLTGAAVLLTANFHVLVFSGIVNLYRVTPMSALGQPDVGFVVESLFSAFGFAVTLSWPFVLANLIYNICLGFINKAMPQMMVAFVGAPFMVGAGMTFLTVSAISLFFVWQDRAPQILGFG